MQREMEALGAVVAGPCQLKIEGVCKYKNEVGAVLVFNDESGRQWDVCKNCSDYMFAKGEWYKKGEKPPKSDTPTSKLNLYISEIKSAKDDDEIIKIGNKYADQRWILSVPISVGMYTEPFFVVEVSVGALGWVSIAFQSEEESTPAVVKVRPVFNKEELNKSEGAILFVEEKIR